MKIDLEHIAAVQIGAFLQVDGYRLDKAHQHNNGKTQVARDLWENDGQQTEPAAAGARDPHHRLHAENRNDGGKHREHHARHHQTVQEVSALKAVAHQPVGGKPGQNDHHDGHGAGDNEAVQVGVFKV